MLLSGSHLNTLEPDAGLIIDETILDSSAEENTLIYFPFFSKGGGGGGGALQRWNSEGRGISKTATSCNSWRKITGRNFQGARQRRKLGSCSSMNPM